MTNPPLWKASVALTKAESADICAALELGSEPQAVLIVEEPFADGAVVEALYAEEPDAGYLSRIAGFGLCQRDAGFPQGRICHGGDMPC